MTTEQMLVFLRVKLGVIAKIAPKGNGRSLHAAWDPILDRLEKTERVAVGELRSVDRELSGTLRAAVGSEVATTAEDAIESIVGVRSLNDTPEKIVRRALKRGHISTPKEAKIVRDFLADGNPQDVFDHAATQKLGALLDGFEAVKK